MNAHLKRDSLSIAPALRAYLDKYTEPEIQGLSDWPEDKTYQQVLVVPLFDEPLENLIRLLQSLSNTSAAQEQRLLALLIINAPTTASDAELVRTRQLLESCKASMPEKWLSDTDGLSLRHYKEQIDVLLVDRCGPGNLVPTEKGVGLARKLGNDLAYRLIFEGHIRSSWLFNTDADVQLPADYFSAPERIEPDVKPGALVYPFRHKAEHPELELPLALYELSLHYYATALAWAGSPYAYTTIGSTLAINAGTYAKVRGFPKRNAGEDFYLLNKVNKVSPVVQVAGEPLLIAGRLSERVPFGTGPGIAKLFEHPSPEQAPLFYHPDCFERLRQWLLIAPKLWPFNEAPKPVETALDFLTDQLDSSTLDALHSLGLAKGLTHCFKQAADQQAFIRQLHTWFDGFRTLKLIHYLRDQHYPSLGFVDLYKTMPTEWAETLGLAKALDATEAETKNPALSRVLKSYY